MLGAKKIVVVPVEDIFLAIEKDEIDADIGLEILHRMGQLHHEGHAGAAVVGADEFIMPLAAIRFLVGNWPGVVMRAKDDALFPVGKPGDDHVGHGDIAVLAALLSRESLVRNFAAQLFEVFLQEFLLFSHTVGAADPRADFAEILQVANCPLAIKGRRLRRPCGSLGGEFVPACSVLPFDAIGPRGVVKEHAGHHDHQDRSNTAQQPASPEPPSLALTNSSCLENRDCDMQRALQADENHVLVA